MAIDGRSTMNTAILSAEYATEDIFKITVQNQVELPVPPAPEAAVHRYRHPSVIDTLEGRRRKDTVLAKEYPLTALAVDLADRSKNTSVLPYTDYHLWLHEPVPQQKLQDRDDNPGLDDLQEKLEAFGDFLEANASPVEYGEVTERTVDWWSWLDEAGYDAFLEILRDAVEENGTTYLLASTDPLTEDAVQEAAESSVRYYQHGYSESPQRSF